MKFFSQLNKKNSGFAKKLIVSYSLLLLLVLVIGAYLFHISDKNLQSSLETQASLQLDSGFTELSNDFDAMRSFAMTMCKNSEVSKLARLDSSGTDSFYGTAYYAQQSLDAYAPTQALLPIDSYFIYLQESDYCLAPGSFSSAQFYYNHMPLPQESYGTWHDILQNTENYGRLIPLTSLGASSQDFLYILPMDTYMKYKIPASLCLIVSYDKIAKDFSALSATDGSLYLSISSVLTSDDPGKASEAGTKTDATSAPPVDTSALNRNTDTLIFGKSLSGITSTALQALSYTNNIAHTTLQGQKCSVLRTEPATNGYVSYYVLPYSSIRSTLLSYRLMFVFVVLAGLALGIFLIFALTKINVRPFIEMDSELDASLAHAQQLQSTLDSQQPLVRSSYIRSLMLGRVTSEDELNYIENYLGLSTTGHIYNVLYIMTYPDDQAAAEKGLSGYTDESGEFTYGSALTFDTNVLSCLREVFGSDLKFFVPKHHAFALLINQDAQLPNEEAADAILKKFHAFHKKALESYAIWSIAGLGNYNHLPENVWKSYQQAVECLSYVSAANPAFRYGAIKLSEDQYYYPDQLSESLSNFITSGNKAQVAETFKFISKENLKLRALSYPKMAHLLMEIHNTVFRIRCTIADEDMTDGIRAADRLMKDVQSLKQLEDASQLLCDFFKERTSKHQTIDSIKKYIQDNYTDASLCLAKLSDVFHLSESYLSYLFKESAGENFSQYLEQIRMKEAARLVKETNAPLSTLYEQTGYNNANSFRRVFKKTYGMSPKTMRETAGKTTDK